MLYFFMETENHVRLENKSEKGLSRTDIGDQVDITKTGDFNVGIVGRGRDSLLSVKELLGVNLAIGCFANDKLFNVGDIVLDTPEVFDDSKRGNQKKFYDRFVKIPKNLRSRIR